MTITNMLKDGYQVIDLVNKDFGYKFGLKRDLTITYYDCKNKHDQVHLQPKDTISFHACEGKTISWDGTLVWDGRTLREKKK